MLRWLLMLTCLVAIGGCCNERDALVYDVQRSGDHAQDELVGLRRDIDRYIRDNLIEAQYLPFDAGRFLDWRKREWWVLRDELADAMLYDWNDIEKITLDVGRYYGYNISNFPHLKKDVMRFFLHSDEEWRNLVMDVCIYVEFQKREVVPLREDLHRFYQHTEWEIANLDIDLRGFLTWREREYEPLKLGFHDWFAANVEDWGKLQYDMLRFRAETLVEGHEIKVDFKNFWAYEHATVPRLEDDVSMFLQFKRREFDKLRDGAARFALFHTSWEVDALAKDLMRYGQNQADCVAKLMLDVDAFFSFYDREYVPLEADVKRWWRFNIAHGRFALLDMQHFYEHHDEEGAALQQDMKRFFAYGGVEWADLVEHVKRFATCARDPAYGDQVTPMRMSTVGPVMEDPVVRDWDINN